MLPSFLNMFSDTKGHTFVSLGYGFCYSNKKILFYQKEYMDIFSVDLVKKIWLNNTKNNCLQIQVFFCWRRKTATFFFCVWGTNWRLKGFLYIFILVMSKHTNEFRRLRFLCYIIAESYYLLESQKHYGFSGSWLTETFYFILMSFNVVSSKPQKTVYSGGIELATNYFFTPLCLCWGSTTFSWHN